MQAFFPWFRQLLHRLRLLAALVLNYTNYEGLNKKPQRHREHRGRGREEDSHRWFTAQAWCGGVLGLLCLFLGWSFPAQAASQISSQLEEQVLQIIREHPEVLIESVQAYQQEQQQKLQATRQAFLQKVQTNPQALIGESPTTGSSESKVVLFEFSDFECPYCAEAHKTLKKFMAKHQNEVMLVYKHFPLAPIHNEAMPAARAAWAALQQGKFWEYHDALFTHQKQLGEAFYIATAKSLNLDLEKFERDAFGNAPGERQIANPAIQKDMQLAQELGLSGTPFFVMNGQTLSGAVKLSEMESALSRVIQ
jgi:protein-disulfide isomerase